MAKSWAAGGPPVLWTRELGDGYSGFVAVGGSVFTQFQNATGMYVIALDADTGHEVWKTRVDWGWHAGGAYPGPYSTPTWYRDRVFYTTSTGKVGALSAETGREQWSLNVIEKFAGKGAEFGYAATATVEDGRLYLPVGGPGASVVALNSDDGTVLWASGDDQASYCPILPITFVGKRILVAYLRNSIVLHDAATGSILWHVGVSSHYDEHSAWPLYQEPRLTFAAPFRAGAQSFRLEQSKDGLSARQEWSTRELSNDVASSVLYAGNIYGFDLQQTQSSEHRASRGKMTCLDVETGKLRWKTDSVGQATILVADGMLIMLNDTGTLILARASPAAYEEISRVHVLDNGLCWTPPTLWRGRLFVRDHARATCLFIGEPKDLPVPAVANVARATPWFEWPRLLTREPEFPNDAPTAWIVAGWFAWCLGGVFAVAGVVSLAVRCFRATWTMPALIVTAFCLGAVGTTVYSIVADTFVFTWPASLYVGFRSLIALTGRRDSLGSPRWLPRAASVAFLGLCYGYYWLCSAVGYLMAWSFLMGFLPAAPFAVMASRQTSPWARWPLEFVAFAVYFWVSGLLPSWRDTAPT